MFQAPQGDRTDAQSLLAERRPDGAPEAVRRESSPPDCFLIRLTPQEPWQAPRR